MSSTIDPHLGQKRSLTPRANSLPDGQNLTTMHLVRKTIDFFLKTINFGIIIIMTFCTKLKRGGGGCG
jgi:hypothetical protein